MLAFAPFTQQSNTIRLRTVQNLDTTSNATISRSVQFNNFDWDMTLVPSPLMAKPLFNTSQEGEANCKLVPGHGADQEL
jgi:hypothetical protein